MTTSNYTVRFDEIEQVREELTLARKALSDEKYEHARTAGALAATQEQLKRASQRAGELQAKVYDLEGALGDQSNAIDELTFSARKDLGVRGRT